MPFLFILIIMRILAIETSCDETAIALVSARGGSALGGEAKGGLNPLTSGRSAGWRIKILKNLVASQIKIHRPFGGVVPNLAKREHARNLPLLFKKISGISNFQFPISKQTLNPKSKILNTIDLIAVTVGPGLEPCLWTGINFAKELHKELKIKNKELRIIGVSHLDGHLYSNLLNSKSRILYPAVALIISGGHTILLLMKDLIHYKKLGETRDDAVGECFDKVARLLKLPYPGGPEIEKLTKQGNPTAINFPRPMINQKNYDFSFSGLKTSVFYYLRDNKNVKIEDVAASFQLAAFDALVSKTLRAAKEFKAKSILISGGVAANKTLHKEFQKAIKFQFSNSSRHLFKTNLEGGIPPAAGQIPQLLITQFPTDNAVMIAAAGYINHLRNKNHRLMAQGNLTLK